MKKAFTLVEMLIVIAIIGLLMAALVVHLRGGTESARSAQCLTNMKNLASAVTQYAQNSQHFALAGSVEKFKIDDSRGVRDIKERYYELPGWISWNSQGAYKSNPQSHIANSGWFTSAYEQDDIKRWYALTNGVIWKYMNGAASCYTCPNHLRKVSPAVKPFFSYVMNGNFGWDASLGGDAMPEQYYGEFFADVKRPDKTLLFCELQWEQYTGKSPNFNKSPGTENDCTLQYESSEGGETVGFNHKNGRDVVAHVVFADGHVEKLAWPSSGMSDSELRELTEWLCEGKDISFNGKKYEKLK